MERYLRFPTKIEIYESHIMEEFIWILKGERVNKLKGAMWETELESALGQRAVYEYAVFD